MKNSFQSFKISHLFITNLNFQYFFSLPFLSNTDCMSGPVICRSSITQLRITHFSSQDTFTQQKKQRPDCFYGFSHTVALSGILHG